jgi:hypothetical protein
MLDDMSQACNFYAAVLVFCGAGHAHAQCGAPDLVEPRNAVVADTRPRVAWTRVPGATAYALSLQSRVAEGRLIGSYDVSIASNEFVPPAALTDEKATVTLAVAARCGATAGPVRTASFRIDATRTCATPQKVTIANEGGKLRVGWQPDSSVVHYEVRAHAPADGKPVASLEVRVAQAELDAPATPGTTVSIRPRCASAYGEAAVAVLAPQ